VNYKEITLNFRNVDGLKNYVASQLHSLFPMHGLAQDIEAVNLYVPRALERMRPILSAVRAFKADEFNHFNSLQYATFLYLLANEMWRTDKSNCLIADRLFCLNRALSGMDLFYAVEMPEIFFISHGIGSVIGNATYGNRFAFFQNVTVGRVGDFRPKIGENAILYPGVTITGEANIGNNVVISAGIFLHNIEVPDDTVVISEDGQINFKNRKRNYSDLYFDNCFY